MHVTATHTINTLSLHDALPISVRRAVAERPQSAIGGRVPIAGDSGRCDHRGGHRADRAVSADRSEEHTSELQSRENLVCRLLLEKKKELVRPFATAAST